MLQMSCPKLWMGMVGYFFIIRLFFIVRFFLKERRKKAAIIKFYIKRAEKVLKKPQIWLSAAITANASNELPKAMNGHGMILFYHKITFHHKIFFAL